MSLGDIVLSLALRKGGRARKATIDFGSTGRKKFVLESSPLRPMQSD